MYIWIGLCQLSHNHYRCYHSICWCQVSFYASHCKFSLSQNKNNLIGIGEVWQTNVFKLFMFMSCSDSDCLSLIFIYLGISHGAIKIGILCRIQMEFRFLSGFFFYHLKLLQSNFHAVSLNKVYRMPFHRGCRLSMVLVSRISHPCTVLGC